MNRGEMEYLKTGSNNAKVIRTEILFTPLLIVLPILVGFIFIYDWFCRGFSMGNSAFDGELIIGVIILISNIVFDIPFIKFLKRYKK
jgi:hypothetical protein